MIKMIKVLPIGFILLSSGFTANAGEYMSADEIQTLIAGNSAKGVHLKRDFSYNIYFSSDGALQQIKANGDERKGQWMVKSNGKHCVEFDGTDVRKCWHIRSNGDGSYTKVKLKGNKVIPLLIWRDFEEGNTLSK